MSDQESGESFDAVETASEGTQEGEVDDREQTLDEWAEDGDDWEPEGTPEPPKSSARVAKAAPGGKKGSERSGPDLPYDPNAKVTIKVDGEDVEITLDQAVREYRRRQAADKRFQEAAATRKQAETLLSQLKSDPWGALKALGIDPDKAASERILAKIEEEKLAAENPSELSRRRLEKELAEERSAHESAKKAAEEAELSKKRDEFRVKIDRQFTAALTEAKLPATPYTVARMADVMSRNIREDPQFDATPTELAQLVREDLKAELVDIARQLGPDGLEAFLGAESMKALRKYDIERVRNPKMGGPARRVSDVEQPARRRRVDYTDPIAAKKALDAWAEEG